MIDQRVTLCPHFIITFEALNTFELQVPPELYTISFPKTDITSVK